MRDGADAVHTGERPEVDQDHVSPQPGHRERSAVDPPVDAREFRSREALAHRQHSAGHIPGQRLHRRSKHSHEHDHTNHDDHREERYSEPVHAKPLRLYGVTRSLPSSPPDRCASARFGRCLLTGAAWSSTASGPPFNAANSPPRRRSISRCVWAPPSPSTAMTPSWRGSGTGRRPRWPLPTRPARRAGGERFGLNRSATTCIPRGWCCQKPETGRLPWAASLIRAARSDADRRALAALASAIGDPGPPLKRVRAAERGPAVALMRRTADRRRATVAGAFPLWVDRQRAGMSAWYEMFPRSEGAEPPRSGTF